MKKILLTLFFFAVSFARADFPDAALSSLLATISTFEDAQLAGTGDYLQLPEITTKDGWASLGLSLDTNPPCSVSVTQYDAPTGKGWFLIARFNDGQAWIEALNGKGPEDRGFSWQLYLDK